MKFGLYGYADVSSIGRAVRAEQLGFDMVSFSDSPLAFSDVFVTMAMVAEATKKVAVSSYVSVAGLRLPAAAAYATINQIAPGRVIAGLGVGTTSYGFMGHRSPVKQADLADSLRVLRGLLDGDEVQWEFNGKTRPMKFLMPERGFVNVEDRVPLFLAAHGPKGQELAGELADGVIEGWGRFHDIDILKKRLQAGAARSGRDLTDFAIFNPGNLVVIDPGESPLSDRVIEEAGAFACIVLHEIYQKFGRAPAEEVPPFVAPIWDEYCSMMESWPDPERFHYRSFAGHQVFIHPEERHFITPELIQATSIVGRPEEIVETLRMWDAAGITHVNISGSAQCIDEKMERFARLVLAKL